MCEVFDHFFGGFPFKKSIICIFLYALSYTIDLRGFDVVLHRTREFSLSARSLTESVRETE